MEISSIDHEDPYDVYKAINPVVQSWEKVGQAALIGFSVMAVCAFIPAFVKKKRIYSPTSITPGLPAMEIVDAAVAEGQPKPQIPVPRCTIEEQRKVEEIFHTVAQGGANLALPWVAYRLIRLGNEIDHIHPFAFLLAAPKHRVREIFAGGNDFKISSVLKGIVKGMEREYARRNLERFATSFATEMGKVPDRVKPFLRSRDWKGLTHYLFDLTHN